MSSLPSPSDKINSVAEVMPQRDGKEGTADHLNEAAQRFVELGDAGPIFMTCESGGERGPMVVLKCTDLSHAHAVNRAIIDIVHAVRQL